MTVDIILLEINDFSLAPGPYEIPAFCDIGAQNVLQSGQIIGLPLTSVTPSNSENIGGTEITVVLDGLAAGTYQVHVGANMNATDPKLYAPSGNGDSITVTVSGSTATFTGYAPPLPVGGPYGFYLVPTAGGDPVSTTTGLTVLPHDFNLSTLRLRNLLSRDWRVGYRSTFVEEFPQT